MTYSVEIDQRQLSNIIDGLRSVQGVASSRDVIEAIALMVKNRILLRTNAGQDVNYTPFKAYNPAYAKKEGKGIVNLTLTGEMLNSMTQKAISNDTAKIFFTTDSARQKARWHNDIGAGKNKVIREFFGVNKDDGKLAEQMYDEAIKAEIKKRGLS